jgi:diguanylate cyclase (GGDEF)-like protein/PAS domain S-box-containing protein
MLHRSRNLRVLFVATADSSSLCVRELTKAQYTIDTVIVSTLSQCTERFRSEVFDLVVADYPSAHWNGAQDLKLLQQTAQDTPLLFLLATSRSQHVMELTAHGTFDYLERTHLTQLPMLVRRILNEKKLRKDLEDAARALECSQSQYRALADNPAHGILRCSAQGDFLDVNDALVRMLGYSTKGELLAASDSNSFLDLGFGLPFAADSQGKPRIEPIELGWKRKNGTVLRAQVSGLAVCTKGGEFMRYEIIVTDITGQRDLENQLRREAGTDSLTGLTNRRRLIELLQAEISRSNRTQREFSFVLLDMDELKKINDRLGHLVGDRALCRLAQILADCSRSVDTCARHGGDEFALVLPETDVVSAALVAQRIRMCLAQDQEDPHLSVSFGIAGFPTDADSISSLLHAADTALYTMKAARPAKTNTAQTR